MIRLKRALFFVSVAIFWLPSILVSLPLQDEDSIIFTEEQLQVDDTHSLDTSRRKLQHFIDKKQERIKELTAYTQSKYHKDIVHRTAEKDAVQIGSKKSSSYVDKRLLNVDSLSEINHSPKDGDLSPLTSTVCSELGFNLQEWKPENNLTPKIHGSEQLRHDPMISFLPLMLADKKCGDSLRLYLELIYFKPCMKVREEGLLPCRHVCKRARDHCTPLMRRVEGAVWPVEWGCGHLPLDGLCADVNSHITPVPEPHTKLPMKNTHSATSAKKPQRSNSSYKVKEKNIRKATATENKPGLVAAPVPPPAVQPRRYDIRTPGEKDLFHGWVDVQGQGAANDYCRVVGTNPNQRFLSCTLGGSEDAAHTYVSKRGFDVGVRHTWFMRDMDDDGRDDYCRCVGKGLNSKMVCMKAGEYGFHGSIKEAGNEYSFTLKTSGPCINKIVNPFLGL